MQMIQVPHMYCFILWEDPSWQIDGDTIETVTDFIFWGSKITADGAAMKLKDAYFWK